ncbi:MAG: UbiX family flavin prenyltransferase [Fuerstiella sp.]|nr:UbiX family flavin prenyltransferase [Fuerstiella sp.]
MKQRNFVLAITGASGSAYAVRLAQILLRAGHHIHMIVSRAARQVAQHELDARIPADDASGDDWLKFTGTALTTGAAAAWGFSDCSDDFSGNCSVHGISDFTAGVASGSFLTGGMVICPCSMGTLSAIACGSSMNLIQRSADVHLKERRPLILIPRETPLSLVALENMTQLSHAGATILPAMPGFYHRPESIADCIDFVVARTCDHLNVEHSLVRRWSAAD